MTKFSHARDMVDGVPLISLGGVIDEDSELERLADDLDGERVIIDVADVERINAAGLAAWRALVTVLVDHRGMHVSLQRCSGAMIAQLSEADAQAVDIETVAVPYFCTDCDEPRTLYSAVSELGEPPQAPFQRCPSCDLGMQFDDQPTYFAFLGLGVAPAPIPEAELSSSSLQALPPAAPESARATVYLIVAGIVLIVGAALALFFSS